MPATRGSARNSWADRLDSCLATPASRRPFPLGACVPIFAACAIQWNLITRSCVRSAGDRRSSDFGHFVLDGARMSTSAVGFLAATLLRLTKAKNLTLQSPRMTDHSLRKTFVPTGRALLSCLGPGFIVPSRSHPDPSLPYRPLPQSGCDMAFCRPGG
jgi:hypothetical protein